MNRRAFLLSLPFMPAALKAVVKVASVPQLPARWVQFQRRIFYHYPNSNTVHFTEIQPEEFTKLSEVEFRGTNGIHAMLERCADVVAKPDPDMDAIFARIYAAR